MPHPSKVWRVCLRKRKFLTKRAACNAKRRREQACSGLLRVYFCPYCSGWHLSKDLHNG